MGRALADHIGGFIFYLAIRLGAVLSRAIPRRWRYLIGTAVGDVVYMVWTGKRRTLIENMAMVLGLHPRDREVRRVARKSMRNYCKYLVEFLELPVLTSLDPIIRDLKVEGLDRFLDALQKGDGVLIGSAHFGTIEIPGLRLADFTGTFHAVYDQFKPGYLDRLIREKRIEKSIDPIPSNNVRAMLKALKAGGTMAVLFDKPVEPGKGVRVRFFGRETWVPGGPAMLAMRSGSAIIPIYTFRHPDLTFETHVYPVISWTPTGDRDRDMQTIMQKLMDSLQHAIRQHPDQWYMFRPMWPKVSGYIASGAPETAAGEP